MVLAQLGVVRVHVVGHPHQVGAVPGGLRRLGDHGADDLAAERDPGGLQDRELPVGGVRQSRRVEVGHHQ